MLFMQMIPFIARSAIYEKYFFILNGNHYFLINNRMSEYSETTDK
jgi:hypothetical protein